MKEAPLLVTQAALDKHHYSSLAALVLLIVEYAATCKHEYALIWRSPWSTVKFLYLGSRYSALVAEIVHYYLIHAFLLRAPVKLETCRAWLLFLSLICTVLMAILDYILFLRVYALYQKDRRVYTLFLLRFLPYVPTGVVIWRNLFHANSFTDTCDLTTTPIEAAMTALAFAVAHLVLWIASYAKRNIAQGHSIVVKLVVREGAWVFALVSAITVGLAPYYALSRTTTPFILCTFAIAGISTTSCRLIMSTRKLRVESSSVFDNQSDFPLTTFIHTSQDLETRGGLDNSRVVT